jgi:hypothetical protein
METSEASIDTRKPARKARKIWKWIDRVSRLGIAMWVVPALFIANAFSERAKEREVASQRERVGHEQRVAEADLARSLIPLLLRPGAERGLALRVMSWVAPDHATNLLDALQAAGEPVETETATVVRATSATRKAARASEEAIADARARRDHGNHPEAFRAFHAVYDQLPPPLKARVDPRRVAAAEAVYARGEYESASRLLEEALASTIATSLPSVEPALAAEAGGQP